MSDTGSGQQSAYDVIAKLLAGYGLSELSGFVNDLVFKENVLNTDIIYGRVKETAEYAKRFAGNEARRRAGFNVLSEEAYIGQENTYRQLLRTAGLPAGFYDSNEDFTAFISGDVSPSELNTRINDGYNAVKNSDPQVIAEMQRLYGVDDSQLAAYFLDPVKATPILVRQAQASQISAQATRQANAQITAQQAEQLAIEGITTQQAQAGFATIGQAQELFNPLAGEQGVGMTQQEQIGAVFSTDAAAAQRLRKKQAERTAAFQGGGGFAGQGQGQTALA
jgi:hypothetical protein